MPATANENLAAASWEHCLPFEKPLAELYAQIEAAPAEERPALEQAFEEQRRAVFLGLTPWERVQLARHPKRPHMLDYVRRLFDDLVELRGDRLAGDDPAMVGGLARFEGETVVVVGQEKGATTEEKVSRNFGMAHPEGYRKALRLFKLAERMGLPIITFVDTPAAHPGIEAEEHGQGTAIATNLLEMFGIRSPILSIVIGEGGSGGALGIAVADYVAMLEHSIYVICPPERCAEILWRDVEKKEIAASTMRVTAHDLEKLGVIDAIVEEPNGGAHRDAAAAAGTLRAVVRSFMAGCAEGQWTPAARQAKFDRMGVWTTA